MTTAAQMVERTRRHLYSGETRDERDTLATGIDADDVGLAVASGRSGLQRGVILGIDLEEMYVNDVSSGINATVVRGDGGSTAAAHSAGAVVWISPKFSTWSIFQAINEELVALRGEGLYRTRTVDLTYAPGTDAYDLTSVTDIDDILDVEYNADDGSGRWSTLPRSEWMLRRDLPTSSFASGLALTVNGWVSPGQTLRVAYRSGFTALSALANDVEAVSFLPASMHDIVPLGAAIRLLAGAEVPRNFLDQYETRRADEVPAGARLGEMRTLMLLRQERIAAEVARLYSRNPVVRR